MPWSDWHDNVTTDAAAANAFQSAVSIRGDYATDSPVGDISAILTTLLGEVRAGTGVLEVSGIGWNFEAAKLGSGAGGGGSVTAKAVLGQCLFSFSAQPPALEYDATVLDGLVDGVDYGPSPDGDTIDWEAPEPALLGWQDFDIDVWALYYSLKSFGGVTVEGSLVEHNSDVDGVTAGEISYRALSTRIVTGELATVAWPTVGIGTEIASLTTTIPEATLHATHYFPGTYIDNEASPDVYSVTLPLSTLGVLEDVTIVAQTNYLPDALAEPFADFTVGAYPDRDLDVEGDAQLERKVLRWSAAPLWGAAASPAAVPVATFQQPRWRYWIPEDDPLRTVGDHFRSVGGADIKSLIPGVGWVKVRRGS